ncbi:MAG: sugar transferase, partial [Sedimentisphaerales bacterium]
MNLIVIRQNRNFFTNSTCNLLRLAVCSEQLANIILSCLNGNRSNNETIAIPQPWVSQTTKNKSGIIYYKDKVPVSFGGTSQLKAKQWFIVSDGGFVTRIDHQWLCKVLAQLRADVVAVNVSPQLQAGYEKVLVNSQRKLVGFRRFYNDLAQPTSIPDDWPHHLFVKADILNKLLVDDALPLSFTEFISNCFSNLLTVRGLNIGGTVLDLGTEEGLLGFLATRLNFSAKNHHNPNNGYQKEILDRDGIEISPGARLFGKILFGQDVSIGPNAIIVGPTIIGNGVKIAKGAVVRASIVGSGVSVPTNGIVQNRVLINGQKLQKRTIQAKTNCMVVTTNGIAAYKNSCADNFRIWPRFSYARRFKRVADYFAAIIVLILFAPIMPFIALAIKLNSSGPVFFKDKRQGLHGKEFHCLKFRTMTVGADRIQDKLRVVNQTDGPQFKIEDDPRVNTVGRFLRDTYIDEIP